MSCDHDKAALRADAYAIRDAAVSLLGQACGHGVELHNAAAVVLGVGAKALRLALGPEEAARIVRAMADEVAADEVAADDRPAGRH